MRRLGSSARVVEVVNRRTGPRISIDLLEDEPGTPTPAAGRALTPPSAHAAANATSPRTGCDNSAGLPPWSWPASPSYSLNNAAVTRDWFTNQFRSIWCSRRHRTEVLQRATT
nr:hypothetical protein GCM10020063_009170 [Dactylosporangium thailandense]